MSARVIAARVGLLATLGLAVSCSRVEFERCAVRCPSSGPCPDGLACAVDGFCHAPGDSESCLPPDAGPAAGEILLAKRVVTGNHHACAIDVTGAVWCWGMNDRGQLGIGVATGQPEPYARRVRGLPDRFWDDVIVGDAYTCVRGSGTLFCWGDDTLQQIGYAADLPGDMTAEPLQIAGGLNDFVVAIAGGKDHACMIMQSDNEPGIDIVSCWGNDSTGMSSGRDGGVSSVTVSAPPFDTLLTPFANYPRIAVGDRFSCAQRLGIDGEEDPPRLECWGVNDSGQYGVGLDVNPTGIRDGLVATCTILRAGPSSSLCASGDTLIVSGDMAATVTMRIVDAAVGTSNVCVVGDDTAVRCAGSPVGGILGNVTTAVPLVQAVNILPSGMRSVSVSQRYACAAEAEPGGPIHCWGTAGEGRLGQGSIGEVVIYPPEYVRVDARDLQ